MDYTQFIILISVMSGFFTWSRRESRSDYKHMEAKTDKLIESIRSDVNAIHQEIKDFHGRLCAIEERRLKEK